jgi:hypothetical protein
VANENEEPPKPPAAPDAGKPRKRNWYWLIAVVAVGGLAAKLLFALPSQMPPSPLSPSPPSPSSPTPPPAGLDWQVKAVSDKLRDTTSVEADAEHDMDNGGKIQITGTCNESAMQLEFAYFAKDDKDSSFETEGSDEDVDLHYRIDDGDVKEATSKTKYKNTAAIVFAYQMSDPNQNADVTLIAGLAAALGGGPQDLRQLLHAREVRFELPLAGGTTEVVSIDPQDAGFQNFVAACKIDIKKIDQDAGKQQAVTHACTTGEGMLRVIGPTSVAGLTAGTTVQPLADSDAVSKGNCTVETKVAWPSSYGAQWSQQYVPLSSLEAISDTPSRQQLDDALKQACTTGQGTVRMTANETLEGAPPTESGQSVAVVNGMLLQPVADVDAVASGKCTVTYSFGTTDYTGKVPMTSLDVPPPDQAQGSN